MGPSVGVRSQNRSHTLRSKTNTLLRLIWLPQRLPNMADPQPPPMPTAAKIVLLTVDTMNTYIFIFPRSIARMPRRERAGCWSLEHEYSWLHVAPNRTAPRRQMPLIVGLWQKVAPQIPCFLLFVDIFYLHVLCVQSFFCAAWSLFFTNCSHNPYRKVIKLLV